MTKNTVKAKQVAEAISKLDSKTVKDIALGIMNAMGIGEFHRSDLTVRDSRTIVFEEVMFNGYQI